MPRMTAGQHQLGHRKINRYTLIELQRIAYKQQCRIQFLQDQMAEKAIALLSAERDAGKAERELEDAREAWDDTMRSARETIASKEESLRAAIRDKDSATATLRMSEGEVSSLQKQVKNAEESLRLCLRDKDAARTEIENSAEELDLIREQRNALHEQVARLENDVRLAEANLLSALDENGRLVRHALWACAVCLVGGAGLGAWLLPGIIKAVWGG